MLLDEGLTRCVIGRFFRVHNVLGGGFPENVYVGALEHECRKKGLHVEREVPIAVYYDGVIVGTFRVDLLIERRLVLEVKSASTIAPPHLRQLMNYLRCTDFELGLLFNFGDKATFKRCIFRNCLKFRRGRPTEPAHEEVNAQPGH
jgi:GxxExxY protein